MVQVLQFGAGLRRVTMAKSYGSSSIDLSSLGPTVLDCEIFFFLIFMVLVKCTSRLVGPKFIF